ncbi:MAG: hypothetical protein H8D93_00880 [Verrucomicrobia bacterium]|nr:hypothetical protein [Verrucomicrobiota bacterium]
MALTPAPSLCASGESVRKGWLFSSLHLLQRVNRPFFSPQPMAGSQNEPRSIALMQRSPQVVRVEIFLETFLKKQSCITGNNVTFSIKLNKVNYITKAKETRQQADESLKPQ